MPPARFANATDLNQHIDRFLARWIAVSPAAMDVFAERTAAWMGLPAPPRRAVDAFHAWGIGMRREHLPPGVWAVWTVEAGRYHVRLSPFLSSPRANFTLWHEWFEVMAARPAFPYPPHGRRKEWMADRFAACLTMPRHSVRRVVQEMEGLGDKTDVTAARFGVSHAAMRRRMRELGLSGQRHVPRALGL